MTMRRAAIVAPMRTVTVAVPVPSPLKVLYPAAPLNVCSVTPNAGGRTAPDHANRYRPFSVCRLHVGVEPFSPNLV